MARSAVTIRDSIVSFIDARLSGINTSPGEPIIDLVDAVAVEGERFNALVDYARKTNSIAGWREVINDNTLKTLLAAALNVSNVSLDSGLARRLGVPEDLANDIEAIIYLDLSRYASSYGRPRRLATASTGTVRLYLPNNSPYTILRGATVRKLGSSAIIYEITTDLLGAEPSFDLAKNLYYVEVGVKSRVPGTVGNSVRNTLVVLGAGITGVVAVSNPAAIGGGSDRESNSELLDALEGVQAGLSVNTEAGLKRILTAQDGVQDVLIVGPGDPLMKRASAGAVDVYVVGEDTQAVTSTTKIQIVQETYVIQLQPVTEVLSATGPGGALSQGNGFTVTEDTGLFAGTAQANTKITWGPVSSGGPSAGDTVTVAYTYNALIRSLQRLLDLNEDLNVPGGSVLVKEADKVTFFLQMAVVPLPGYSQLQAETAADDAVDAFFSTKKLGENIDFSDVLVVAAEAKVDGITAIDRIDNFKMGISADSLGTGNVQVADNQYARLESIEFLAP